MTDEVPTTRRVESSRGDEREEQDYGRPFPSRKRSVDFGGIDMSSSSSNSKRSFNQNTEIEPAKGRRSESRGRLRDGSQTDRTSNRTSSSSSYRERNERPPSRNRSRSRGGRSKSREARSRNNRRRSQPRTKTSYDILQQQIHALSTQERRELFAVTGETASSPLEGSVNGVVQNRLLRRQNNGGRVQEDSLPSLQERKILANNGPMSTRDPSPTHQRSVSEVETPQQQQQEQQQQPEGSYGSRKDEEEDANPEESSEEGSKATRSMTSEDVRERYQNLVSQKNKFQETLSVGPPSVVMSSNHPFLVPNDDLTIDSSMENIPNYRQHHHLQHQDQLDSNSFHDEHYHPSNPPPSYRTHHSADKSLLHSTTSITASTSSGSSSQYRQRPSRPLVHHPSSSSTITTTTTSSSCPAPSQRHLLASSRQLAGGGGGGASSSSYRVGSSSSSHSRGFFASPVVGVIVEEDGRMIREEFHDEEIPKELHEDHLRRVYLDSVEVSYKPPQRHNPQPPPSPFWATNLRCLCWNCFVLGLSILAGLILMVIVAFSLTISREQIKKTPPQTTTTPVLPPNTSSSSSSTDNSFPSIPSPAPTSFFQSLPPVTTEAVEQDPASPQALAFRWLEGDPAYDDPTNEDNGNTNDGGDSFYYTYTQRLHRMALATLYFSTRGSSTEGWYNHRDWLSYSTSVCDWVYNSCSGGGSSGADTVRTLWLTDNGLKGLLPPELCLLHDGWKEIAITKNPDLTGTLPTEMGWLQGTDLKSLNFQSNSLSGTLPPEWGQIRSLQYLYLNNNQFVGSLPREFQRLTHLRFLWLHSNRLSGSLPSLSSSSSNQQQPSEVLQEQPQDFWSSLRDLRELLLQDNQLTGTLPAELGEVSTLRFLNLQNNRFTGTLPRALGRLTNLEILSLHGNQFSGTVPLQVCALLQQSQNALQSLTLDCDLVECTCGCTCYDPTTTTTTTPIATTTTTTPLTMTPTEEQGKKPTNSSLETASTFPIRTPAAAIRPSLAPSDGVN